MKLKFSETMLKTVTCAWLYANGKLVLRHEEPHTKAWRVEWVTIHDTGIRCDFVGRLVLHHGAGLVRMLTLTQYIKARAPSFEHGSENSKKAGIAVGYVSMQLGKRPFHDCVHFHLMDGIISSDFTYQPENPWVAPESPYYWAGYKVSNAEAA